MAGSSDIVALRRQRPTTSMWERDYLVMKPLIDWMRDVAVQYASGELLDFGCGNKPYLEFLESKVASYVGADLTQNAFGTVDIVLGPETRIPVADASFATVLSRAARSRASAAAASSTCGQGWAWIE